MARKYVYLGQEKVSLSTAIKRITGWTPREFENEKRYMRQRVQTFNKITGSELSAIEELYYKVSFEAKQQYYASQGKPTLELNTLQQTLQDLKTTQVKGGTAKQQEILKQFTINRFQKLVEHYPVALNDTMDKLKKGEISIKEAQEIFTEYADKMHNLRVEDPAAYLKEKGNQIGSP